MEHTVFDRLVNELSRSERRNMLRQIEQTALSSEEPLADDYLIPEVNLEEVYKNLGLLSKIIVFLKMLFTGRSREEVLEKDLLGNIIREIQQKSSGIIDFSQDAFLPAFGEELKLLKDSLAPFAVLTGKIMEQNKGDFIAFLSGQRMEEIQVRLLEEIDPYYQAAKAMHKGPFAFDPPDREKRENMELPPQTDLSDAEIKRLMENSLEDILQIIPSDGKALMYQDMKIIQQLRASSQYPFDKLLSVFPSAHEGGGVCPVSRVKDQILKLADIMHGMKEAPPPLLLRAILLFCNDEKTGAGLETELIRQIKAADRILQNIREINKRMPWIPLARYVSRNINYQCPVLGGAEDWFVLLKQFWKNRIEQQFKDFSVRRRERELQKEIRALFAPLKVLQVENYGFLPGADKAGGTYAMSLSAAKTFLLGLFPGDINRYLKNILIDGAFYKEDNRKEFTDGYNALLKAGEILEKFEARLAPGGETARTIKEDMREYAVSAVKRKKVQNAIKEIDLDAEFLLQTLQGGLQSLGRILNGILYGEIGGRYDTLSNLAYLGGRYNAEFRKGVDDTLKKCRLISALLEKLVVAEKAAAA